MIKIDKSDKNSITIIFWITLLNLKILFIFDTWYKRRGCIRTININVALGVIGLSIIIYDYILRCSPPDCWVSGSQWTTSSHGPNHNQRWLALRDHGTRVVGYMWRLVHVLILDPTTWQADINSTCFCPSWSIQESTRVKTWKLPPSV